MPTAWAMRLEGPALDHLGSREIVSDATVPGSIQVPGNGQPIVLLADAQTAGGYPKIATVIGADLPRLAASRPGQVLRFALVDAAEAERLARAAEAETRALIASLHPLLLGGVDEAAHVRLQPGQRGRRRHVARLAPGQFRSNGKPSGGAMLINLNADLGESFGAWKMGEDEALLGVVCSANIACGFHAGDPLVMRRTVRTALAAGVGLGAHPA